MLQVSTQALTRQRPCVQGLTDSLKTALRGREGAKSLEDDGERRPLPLMRSSDLFQTTATTSASQIKGSCILTSLVENSKISGNFDGSTNIV